MSQIYLHIPFCEQKCNYCRFASTWKIQDLHIAKYVSFLCEEIKKQNIFNKKIKTIYFWWWTPWVLKLEQFEKILNTIKNKYILDEECEISIETTPDKISKENLIWWEKLWINRISMWIQTLNQKSLKEIKRWWKWDILEALEIMKEYTESGQTHRSAPTKNNVGVNLCVHPIITNISLDFIIWLPYVKKWEILENIKYVLEKYALKEAPLGCNFIKHISVYMLEDYYSPDKIIETKYDNITYPKDWEKQGIKEEEYLWEYSSIKKFLVKSWFNNYEISNYWKSWFECKHNIWYWEHKEIIAFWLWAYWLIHKSPTRGDPTELIRYANSENFKNYYNWEKIFENKLTQEDIFLEKLMFGLRTSWIEENIYKKLDIKKINYFIENWYLEKKSNKIVLLDKWVLVMDYILKEII